MNPDISVVIASYNNENYIAETIQSILNQTYKYFELIIVDDCSTDNSRDVINSFSDPRIRLLTLNENRGPGIARNTGIKASKAKYVAIIDSDDIACPERLQKQYEFMEKNLQIGASGSWMKVINTETVMQSAPEFDRIKLNSLFNSPLPNPSVIFRKAVLFENNIFYNEQYRQAQDYDLWAKLMWVTELANIPEVLTFYRVHENSITSVHKEKQVQNANIIRLEQLKRYGMNPSEQESDAHRSLSTHYRTLKDEELKKLMEWAFKLYNMALDKKICDKNYVIEVIGSKIPFFFKRCEDLSTKTLKIYEESPFYKVVENQEFKKELRQRAKE